MQIKTLKETDTTTILNTFNLAFAEYFVPLQLTLQQLEQKIKQEKVDLELSVGAFDENNTLCGLILHARNLVGGKQVIYNAGTGVIPEKRGLNLTQRMYDFILPKFQEIQVDHLILEVISENIPAIKTYQKIGFQIQRNLNCYKGLIQTSGQVNFDSIQKLNALEWEKVKSFWDFEPSWQYSDHILSFDSPDCELYGAFSNQKLIAYLFFNRSQKRILQLAVAPEFRQQNIAQSLVAFAINNEMVSMINVEENDSMQAFLKSIGLNHFLVQFEMKYFMNQAES